MLRNAIPMTIVYILLGSTAVGVLCGVTAVYLLLTHSRDHNEGIFYADLV